MSDISNIRPSEESIRHFIDCTWKDIHHSRLQNWTGITVVTAFHVGMLKIFEFSLNRQIYHFDIKLVLLIFGALFCLIGFLITKIHQNQLYNKLNWIKEAEEELNTIVFLKNVNNEKYKNIIPKFIRRNFLTAGSLMGYFFLLLMILDILFIFVPI
jgi:hypothetical protein